MDVKKLHDALVSARVLPTPNENGRLVDSEIHQCVTTWCSAIMTDTDLLECVLKHCPIAPCSTNDGWGAAVISRVTIAANRQCSLVEDIDISPTAQTHSTLLTSDLAFLGRSVFGVIENHVNAVIKANFDEWITEVIGYHNDMEKLSVRQPLEATSC